MKHPLTRIQVAGIPPEGMDIGGEISSVELDLDGDDRIAFPGPCQYQFQISMVSGGLLARGRINLLARCRCDRCLTYFDYPVSLDRLCYFIAVEANDTVDLTDPVREDILLAFPQQLLCHRKCLGLCGDCGQNKNVRQCDCHVRGEPDTVWSELNKLVFSDDENNHVDDR